MSELRIPFVGAINAALLSEELAAVMGEHYRGVSTGPGFIQFNDIEGIPADVIATATATARAHDGTQKTVAQQEADVKRSTLTDFVTAASTMQSQLDALIAANTADLTALASDRDIPDALKPYLTRIIQRSAAAITAQSGAFQVAMVLAGQYASNPNSIQTVP
jgi:hypothetical protein